MMFTGLGLPKATFYRTVSLVCFYMVKAAFVCLVLQLCYLCFEKQSWTKYYQFSYKTILAELLLTDSVQGRQTVPGKLLAWKLKLLLVFERHEHSEAVGELGDRE